MCQISSFSKYPWAIYVIQILINSTIHTGVTPPEDWIGFKYSFDGTTWTANSNWVEYDPNG